MTAANQTLIVSEGTDLLLFLDVHTKKETKRVKVKRGRVRQRA